MKIQTLVTKMESFKTFLQGGNYEQAILDLMNSSKKVFPFKYEHNDNQSCGECDFISFEGEERVLVKYDVKLPFDTKEGKLICSEKGDFLQWINFMIDEVTEFSHCIIENRGLHNVNELQLYKTMDKRLNTIEEDENAIFFFPFPITIDGEDMIFTQFATDILLAIFNQLKEEGKIKNRKIYVIYPSVDGKITIRCLNNYAREYLYSEEISKHILYEFIT